MLGIGVPVILFATALVDKEWFIMGAVSWLLALGIKTLPLLLSFVFPNLYVELRNKILASAGEGILSAVAELGITLAYFIYNRDELSLNTIISFGLGVGFAEVLLIIYLLIEDIEKISEEMKLEKAKGFVLWRPTLERLLAIAGHVFSRGIIGLVLLSSYTNWIIILPFLSFAFIDGWAGYIMRAWDLTKMAVLKRINLVHISVVLFEAIIFFYLLWASGVLTKQVV